MKLSYQFKKSLKDFLVVLESSAASFLHSEKGRIVLPWSLHSACIKMDNVYFFGAKFIRENIKTMPGLKLYTFM